MTHDEKRPEVEAHQADRPNGLRDRVERIEKLLDEIPLKALDQRLEDQKEDLTWVKRALWGLVFSVFLGVAAYFIRLGAAPPAG